MIVIMGEMRVAEIDPAVRSAVKCSASWGCMLPFSMEEYERRGTVKA